MTFLKEALQLDTAEERQFFIHNTDWIMNNMRFTLDHLDDGTLWVYRVSFEDYKKSKHL